MALEAFPRRTFQVARRETELGVCKRSQFLLILCAIVYGCAMPVSEFKPRDGIEACLLLALRDRGYLADFEYKVLSSDVFVRTRKKFESYEEVAGGRVQFYTFTTSDGGEILPFYSNEQRMIDALGPGYSLKIPGAALKFLNRNESIALNYRTNMTFEWGKGEFGYEAEEGRSRKCSPVD